MPTYTKYRHLTTRELLNKLDNIRHHSPIINELIIRIEEDNMLNTFSYPNNVECRDTHTLCPVCESVLSVEYDSNEDLFRLSESPNIIV